MLFIFNLVAFVGLSLKFVAVFLMISYIFDLILKFVFVLVSFSLERKKGKQRNADWTVDSLGPCVKENNSLSKMHDTQT